ncbi:heterokaryon incompatibility protein-domain-containing protein [Phlebopus sp. FC_14]|nr:heterokaryon incompatibility protein-domain-containing protein [Phlebopus sp. FC_14]
MPLLSFARLSERSELQCESPAQPEQVAFRRLLRDTFDQYVFNEIPERLIYIPKMKMIARWQTRILLWPHMEAFTERDLFAVMNKHSETMRTREQGLRQLIKERSKYAMLSHRWFDDGDEPTFQNFSFRKTRSLSGYKKLVRFCKKARNDYGCDLAWADTCCIDKTSSSELDEAIRSMFRWYSNSYVCIAYLGDSSTASDFEDEVWFMRGWTLQELLAPTLLKFYGKGWLPISNSFNDKQDASVISVISRVTTIPEDDLVAYIPGPQRVREKMMWAARRRTTRVEDIAYSLIGVFDLGMAIAYGEGDRAFYRLMVEIVESCHEWDIFLFEGEVSPFHFALPQAPQSYHELPSSWTQWNKTHPRGNKWFTLTKRGMQFRLLVIDIDPVPHTTDEKIVYSIAVNATIKHPDIFDHALALVGLKVSELDPDTFRYAIGIVDFERGAHEGEGQLLWDRDYFCFLVRRRAGYELWEVVETVGPTVVHCKQDLLGQPIASVVATDVRW